MRADQHMDGPNLTQLQCHKYPIGKMFHLKQEIVKQASFKIKNFQALLKQAYDNKDTNQLRTLNSIIKIWKMNQRILPIPKNQLEILGKMQYDKCIPQLLCSLQRRKNIQNHRICMTFTSIMRHFYLKFKSLNYKAFQNYNQMITDILIALKELILNHDDEFHMKENEFFRIKQVGDLIQIITNLIVFLHQNDGYKLSVFQQQKKKTQTKAEVQKIIHQLIVKKRCIHILYELFLYAKMDFAYQCYDFLKSEIDKHKQAMKRQFRYQTLSKDQIMKEIIENHWQQISRITDQLPFTTSSPVLCLTNLKILFYYLPLMVIQTRNSKQKIFVLRQIFSKLFGVLNHICQQKNGGFLLDKHKQIIVPAIWLIKAFRQTSFINNMQTALCSYKYSQIEQQKLIEEYQQAYQQVIQVFYSMRDYKQKVIKKIQLLRDRFTVQFIFPFEQTLQAKQLQKLKQMANQQKIQQNPNESDRPNIENQSPIQKSPVSNKNLASSNKKQEQQKYEQLIIPQRERKVMFEPLKYLLYEQIVTYYSHHTDSYQSIELLKYKHMKYGKQGKYNPEKNDNTLFSFYNLMTPQNELGVQIGLFPLTKTILGQKMFEALYLSLQRFLYLYANPQQRINIVTANPFNKKCINLEQMFLTNYQIVHKNSLQYDLYFMMVYELILFIKWDQLSFKNTNTQLFYQQYFKVSPPHYQAIVLYYMYEFERHEQFKFQATMQKFIDKYLTASDMVKILKFLIKDCKIDNIRTVHYYNKLLTAVSNKVMANTQMVNTQLFHLVNHIKPDQIKHTRKQLKNTHSKQFSDNQHPFNVQQKIRILGTKFDQLVDMFHYWILLAGSAFEYDNFCVPQKHPIQLAFFCKYCYNVKFILINKQTQRLFQNVQCPDCNDGIIDRFELPCDQDMRINKTRMVAQVQKLAVIQKQQLQQLIRVINFDVIHLKIHKFTKLQNKIINIENIMQVEHNSNSTKKLLSIIHRINSQVQSKKIKTNNNNSFNDKYSSSYNNNSQNNSSLRYSSSSNNGTNPSNSSNQRSSNLSPNVSGSNSSRTQIFGNNNRPNNSNQQQVRLGKSQQQKKAQYNNEEFCYNTSHLLLIFYNYMAKMCKNMQIRE